MHSRSFKSFTGRERAGLSRRILRRHPVGRAKCSCCHSQISNDTDGLQTIRALSLTVKVYSVALHLRESVVVVVASMVFATRRGTRRNRFCSNSWDKGQAASPSQPRQARQVQKPIPRILWLPTSETRHPFAFSCSDGECELLFCFVAEKPFSRKLTQSPVFSAVVCLWQGRNFNTIFTSPCSQLFTLTSKD